MRSVAVGCLVLAGCALDLAQVRADLAPRAATDLSCEASKLEFRELKRPLEVSNVRVEGCGRSQDYTLEEGRWRLVRRPR